jgi:hypothetical protein
VFRLTTLGDAADRLLATSVTAKYDFNTAVGMRVTERRCALRVDSNQCFQANAAMQITSTTLFVKSFWTCLPKSLGWRVARSRFVGTHSVFVRLTKLVCSRNIVQDWRSDLAKITTSRRSGVFYAQYSRSIVVSNFQHCVTNALARALDIRISEIQSVGCPSQRNICKSTAKKVFLLVVDRVFLTTTMINIDCVHRSKWQHQRFAFY